MKKKGAKVKGNPEKVQEIDEETTTLNNDDPWSDVEDFAEDKWKDVDDFGTNSITIERKGTNFSQKLNKTYSNWVNKYFRIVILLPNHIIFIHKMSKI
jgi:hypothetical protein